MKSTERVLDTSRSVILDTSVLADALFSERPRHKAAVEALKEIKRRELVVLIPAHAYFELVSTIFAEHNKRRQVLMLGEFGKELPVAHHVADIDMEFINSHLVPSLKPERLQNLNIGGADLIFLVMALQQSCPLISADERLLKKAKGLGVAAFTSEEYVASPT